VGSMDQEGEQDARGENREQTERWEEKRRGSMEQRGDKGARGEIREQEEGWRPRAGSSKDGEHVARGGGSKVQEVRAGSK
jgi:hypothetical protein